MSRASQLRDLRTVGPLFPEARTCLFATYAQEEIREIQTGKRFLVAASHDSLYVFPTDSTSPVTIGDPSVAHSKKNSTPICGSSVKKPIVSVKKFTQEPIVKISLVLHDQFLIVFTQKSVLYINLANPELTPLPLLTGLRILSAAVFAELIVFSDADSRIHTAKFVVENDRIRASEPDPVRNLPITSTSHNWILSAGSAHSSILPACSGTERIAVFQYQGSSLTCIAHAGLSAQAGDVSRICPISSADISNSSALANKTITVVVCQRDTISVFAQENENEDLELVFQFRDAINKIVFSSIDLIGNFLASVSHESFTGRHRLELHDLHHLKVKSASLQPIRRWDISRLVAEIGEGAVKVFFTRKDVLSFLLTGSPGTAILWEPVLRDHWFPFMPNFVVLNKNEPYIECEEEFDFNQNADPSVVKTSINRYKRTTNIVFDYLPEGEDIASIPERGEQTEVEDINMDEESPEVFFPFLQPVDNWRFPTNKIYKSPQSVPQTDVKFFSEACRESLSRVVG